MNEPRKHHYVAALLLKGFTVTEDRSGILHVFDPATGTSRQETPETHGWKLDYNRIDGARPTMVESDFFGGLIESPAGEPLKKIRTGLPITEKNAYDLASFVAAQALRVPARREAIDDGMKNLVQVTEMVRDGRDIPIEDPLVARLCEGGELKNEDYLAMQLPNVNELAALLMKRSCLILKATGQSEFVCTDDPVTLDPHGAGFGNASGIVMPCGRKHALLFADLPATPVGWYPMDADDMMVAGLNFELIRRSPQWIVSSQPDFDFHPGDGQIHHKADVKLIAYPQRGVRAGSHGLAFDVWPG